jgi:uncharacterized protein
MQCLSEFFFITYVVSWIWFVLAAYVLQCAGPQSIGHGGGLLFIPGVIAPALVALGLTARSEGRSGVFALLGGIARWRVGIQWYLFAIGYMAAIKLAAAVLYRVITGTWPVFTELPWYLMALMILISTPVQAGEEIGWRAFALPRLANRFGLSIASVVLGILWAGWHLPFFFIPGSDNFGQSFWMYLIAVTAISVAMAWLYWRTNRSLLLTMLMHATINNTAGIVTSPATPAVSNLFALSSSLLAWLTIWLFWIFAAYCLVRMQGRYWRIAHFRLPILI